MKAELKKPNCPKCEKPMRLISTGIIVSTGRILQSFHCPECKETKIVERENEADL